jgi:hypothetical protein
MSNPVTSIGLLGTLIASVAKQSRATAFLDRFAIDPITAGLLRYARNGESRAYGLLAMTIFSHLRIFNLSGVN